MVVDFVYNVQLAAVRSKLNSVTFLGLEVPRHTSVTFQDTTRQIAARSYYSNPTEWTAIEQQMVDCSIDVLGPRPACSVLHGICHRRHMRVVYVFLMLCSRDKFNPVLLLSRS